MTATTLSTVNANELIHVEDALDPQGRASVLLGLVNRDRTDTFPGRTLSPDQAEELAAALVISAAASRAGEDLAPGQLRGEAALQETLTAIRAAAPPIEANAAADAAGQPSGRGEASRPDKRVPSQELPIADYDALKASAIVTQLSGLTPAQLSTVLAYERQHRNRKKVRARISAIQAAAAT